MQLASTHHRSLALRIAVIVLAATALLSIGAQRSSADVANPKLSAGVYSTCAIYSNNRVYCWGSNSSNQLGLGSSTKLSYTVRPNPVKGVPAQPVGISNGYSSACSILITGGISCWGSNPAGALGPKSLGKSAKSAQPSASLISPWVAPSNQSTGSQHSCFRDNNATVKCLGTNNYGQLGNASNTPSATPTQVAVLTGASAATRASQVVSGANHSCALLDNRNVKCWGVNNVRQLGTPTNSVAWVNSPVDVPALTNNVTQLASKADHTCAIHANGDVSCWGADSYGQLGDGTVAPFKGAVKVAGLGADARQVSTGVAHTCSLIKGGGVKCWGSNEFGQLGNGTATTSSKPVSVIGLPRPANEISAGGYHSCARLDNGSIYCWGRGTKGQLGNDKKASSLTAAPVVEVAGPHYSGVKLHKTSGHSNFSATLVVRPPQPGSISKRCKTRASVTVTVVQDGVTHTKKIHKKLRSSGSSKCVARLSYRSISKSVSPATLTIKSSYKGNSSLPGGQLTQTYLNQ
jgi:alpha-tubulin suppressor-like RCC1 family protein